MSHLIPMRFIRLRFVRTFQTIIALASSTPDQNPDMYFWLLKNLYSDLPVVWDRCLDFIRRKNGPACSAEISPAGSRTTATGNKTLPYVRNFLFLHSGFSFLRQNCWLKGNTIFEDLIVMILYWRYSMLYQRFKKFLFHISIAIPSRTRRITLWPVPWFGAVEVG